MCKLTQAERDLQRITTANGREIKPRKISTSDAHAEMKEREEAHHDDIEDEHWLRYDEQQHF